MAYQGEYFVERYGAVAASAAPPFARMLAKGLHVSAGTDATRVASSNPWVSLAWLVTGKTVGGLRLYPERNCLDRETALRMWTENVAWFSNEQQCVKRSQPAAAAAAGAVDELTPFLGALGCDCWAVWGVNLSVSSALSVWY